MTSTGKTIRAGAIVLGAAMLVGLERPAMAGKLSWLDDVVREVVHDAGAGGKALVRETGEDGARAARRGGRLFATRNADEGLEALVRQSDDLARSARRIDRPAETLLDSRFERLLGRDREAVRAFASLKPAEKRLVVELGETARRLALRHPDDAERMVRALGPEGLTAVRVYGDDVAEVLAKEGPASLNVLRKTGREGWSFFTGKVLPHKKKLLAAGVLAAFLADPERFVDYAGRATEFAVNEFARAGVALAGAVGGGAARGIENSIGRALAAYGLDSPHFRRLGMGLAIVAMIVSLMVVLGLPVRWMARPFAWLLRPWKSLFSTRAGRPTVANAPRP